MVLSGVGDGVAANGTRRHLNDLTAKEWVRESVSVWTQRGLGKGHPDTLIEREHPAPFSYQDVARVIRFFSKEGDTVIDPFLGVGSTLKAAALEGRNGIGIELNPKYAELSKLRLANEVPPELLAQCQQEVLAGDSRVLAQDLPAGVASLVVTSPPYWNILRKVDHKAQQERISQNLDHHYGDHTADLGNIPDYEEFVEELGKVFAACRKAMKALGHLCVFVGDFRHKSRYYMFHADLARKLEGLGFMTKGMFILHQSQKRVFPYGYPSAFVPNLHHQYILVTRLEL